MPISPNSIIFGDCLEQMKNIEDGSVDMILCDLPYGTTHNQWDTVIPPDKLWEQYNRIIKSNGAILLFGQDKFTATMMLSNSKMHRYNIIWDKHLKSGFLNAKKMPLRQHEDIMVFYKNPPVYNPQKIPGAKNHSKGNCENKTADNAYSNRCYGDFKVLPSDVSGMKYPSSIWSFTKPAACVAIHPTEKPIELLRYAIRTYSNPGDLILDNCCGSGSTLIAAALEGRNYIGIDNGYCDKKNSKYYGLPWVDVATQIIQEYMNKNYG